MTDPNAVGRRHLGLPSAVALVVANMIGVGVFTTSGYTLGALQSRPQVMLAWLIAGVLAMAGALSYGALARRLPHSGGEYFFLSRTVHPLVGFLAGWVSLLAGFTGPIAAAALGLQAYLGPIFGANVDDRWVGTAAIVLAGLLHGVRLGPGVAVQNLAVGVKVLLIFGFIALGVSHLPAAGGPQDAVASPDLQVGLLAVQLVWISFSYSGWNAAVYIAGEIKNPERNLNRSLWVATALVTVIYLGLNAVFVYSAPIETLAGKAEVGAIAAEALGGESLRTAVSLLVALALFTSISAMVMIGPRVYSRMADDGVFPSWFSFRGRVPHAAIALQAALAVALVWFADLRQLLGYLGFTLGISAAVTVIGLIKIRIREGSERVPVPGFPLVPLVFVIFVLGTTGYMALSKQTEALYGLATVALGVPFYFLVKLVSGPAPPRSAAEDDRGDPR